MKGVGLTKRLIERKLCRCIVVSLFVAVELQYFEIYVFSAWMGGPRNVSVTYE